MMIDSVPMIAGYIVFLCGDYVKRDYSAGCASDFCTQSKYSKGRPQGYAPTMTRRGPMRERFRSHGRGVPLWSPFGTHQCTLEIAYNIRQTIRNILLFSLFPVMLLPMSDYAR